MKILRKYNVLLWGSSALEHAIAVKLKQSNLLNKLYVANSSEIIRTIGINMPYNGEELIKKSKELNIDIFICNSGDNILKIIDKFTEAGIKCIGANRKWTLLEASKTIGKKLCKKYNINHPKYSVVNNENDFDEEVKKYSYPVVIKADGYARGAGVFICEDYKEAKNRAKLILNKEIVPSTSRVLIEEFIQGDETSFIQFWDGKHLFSLPPIRDFKRFLDGDKGLNTGGMASYCPQTLTDKQKSCLNKYSKELERILKKENADFAGFIYSGIMFTKEELFVLEYNMRLGFPEGIAFLENSDSDFLEMLVYGVNKKINKYKIKYKNGVSFALNFACKDYPVGYSETCKIKRTKLKSVADKGITIYYGNGKFIDDYFVKKGNYVLTLAHNSDCPFTEIYNTIKKETFDEVVFRKDIHN